VYAFDIGSYWRDVGGPEAYLAAHRDLVAGKIDVFDHPERPVRTMSTGRLPARGDSGAVIGTRCWAPVLGCPARCTAAFSARFDGVVVRAGARIDTAILNQDVQVGAGAVVGADIGRRRARDAHIVLVGKGSRIGRSVEIGKGARLEPGTTA